jgi:hypothetical protein
VAAAAIVVLAFTAALFVALAQEGVTERIRAGAPTVKRWAGYILVLVGAWFVALGVFADFFTRVFPVGPGG